MFLLRGCRFPRENGLYHAEKWFKNLTLSWWHVPASARASKRVQPFAPSKSSVFRVRGSTRVTRGSTRVTRGSTRVTRGSTRVTRVRLAVSSAATITADMSERIRRAVDAELVKGRIAQDKSKEKNRDGEPENLI